MSKSKSKKASTASSVIVEDDDQLVTQDGSNFGGNLDIDDCDESFFQDIDLLQNHGIVSLLLLFLINC